MLWWRHWWGWHIIAGGLGHKANHEKMHAAFNSCRVPTFLGGGGFGKLACNEARFFFCRTFSPAEVSRRCTCAQPLKATPVKSREPLNCPQQRWPLAVIYRSRSKATTIHWQAQVPYSNQCLRSLCTLPSVCSATSPRTSVVLPVATISAVSRPPHA